jgi:hypothetical protein
LEIGEGTRKHDLGRHRVGGLSAGYRLTSADVGHKMTVVVIATDQKAKRGFAVATLTPLVAKPPAPAVRSEPVLFGATREGQYLRSTDGSWSSPDALAYTYQWRRCTRTGVSCLNIARQTSSSYKLTATDLGHRITVVVIAADRESQRGFAVPAAVGPVTS